MMSVCRRETVEKSEVDTSSGTMQLLDRLGHGLLTMTCEGGEGRSSAGGTVLRREDNRFGDKSVDSHTREANLASIRRIRDLVRGLKDSEGLKAAATKARGSSCQAQVASSASQGTASDVSTLFKGVRALLEQAVTEYPGAEEVAFECLRTLADGVALLIRDPQSESSSWKTGAPDTKQKKHHGPGHVSHAYRACVASIVPCVIDCFSRSHLRGPAEGVLAELVKYQAQLLDVPSILVDQLVRHGMEHGDREIRLHTTSASSRLLGECGSLQRQYCPTFAEVSLCSHVEFCTKRLATSRNHRDGGDVGGLQLDARQYKFVLEGLVGRVRDVDDEVVNEAVDALRLLYADQPTRFRSAVTSLEAVHQKLLHHYSQRIYTANDVASDSCTRKRTGESIDEDAHGRVVSPRFAVKHAHGIAMGGGSRPTSAYEHEDPVKTQTTIRGVDCNGSGSSGSDTAGRPRFEPITQGVVRGREPGVPPSEHAAVQMSPQKSLGGTAARSNPITAAASIEKLSPPDKRLDRNGDGSGDVVAPRKEASLSSPLQNLREAGYSPSTPPQRRTPKVVEATTLKTGSNNSHAAISFPSEEIRDGPGRVEEVSPRSPGRYGKEDRREELVFGIFPKMLLRDVLDVKAAVACASTGVKHKKSAEDDVDQEGRNRAGERQRGRVRAMEEVRQLVARLKESSIQAVTPHLGELLKFLVGVASDTDFKIVLLALQAIHAIILCMERRLLPHLPIVFPPMMARLEDHKIAARHHGMVVLSTLVSTVGLPASMPYLVQYGTRRLPDPAAASTVWSSREGALKLATAGLLWSADLEERVRVQDKAVDEHGGNMGAPREESEHDGNGIVDTRDKGVERRARHKAVELDRNRYPRLDERRLVHDVGMLLTDERMAVRLAAVETLAVAAYSWRHTGIDIVAILDDADLIRSGQMRRRLTARLRDPVSSLPHLGPDGTVSNFPGQASASNHMKSSGGDHTNDPGVASSEFAEYSDFVHHPSITHSTSDRRDPGANLHRGHEEPFNRNTTTSPRQKGLEEILSPTSPKCSSFRAGFSTVRDPRQYSTSVSGSPGFASTASEPSPPSTSGSEFGTRCRQNLFEDANLTVPSFTSGRLPKSRRARAYNALGSTAPASLGGKHSADEKDHQNPHSGCGCRERSGCDRGNTWNGSAKKASSRTSPDFVTEGWSVSRGEGSETVDGESSDRRRLTLRRWRSDKTGERHEVARWEQDDSGLAKGRRQDRQHCGQDPQNSRVGGRLQPAAQGDSGGVGCRTEEQWRSTRRRRRPDEDEDYGATNSSPPQHVDHDLASGSPLVGSRRAHSVSAGNPRDSMTLVSPNRRRRASSPRLDGSNDSAIGSVDGGGGGKYVPSWVERTPDTRVQGNRSPVADEGAGTSRRKLAADEYRVRGRARASSPIPDPSLLSTLKRGTSRNARASRRAVSAAAGGGSVFPGAAASGGGDPASAEYEWGVRRSRSRRVSVEPTTPVPVGRYDSMGRRRHMETAIQQPLPLVHTGGGGGSTDNSVRDQTGNDRRETFLTEIEVEEDILSGNASGGRAGRSTSQSPNVGKGTEDRRALREAEKLQIRGGGRYGRDRRRRRSPTSRDAALIPPSSNSALKGDSFDYLTAEDIRPSPNPTQELQRVTSSLPQDDWPEIFHTLNSVRRLAAHHAALLSSQQNLHAMVRDVLGQAENLRSQVAKNALLSLADLWRGLGDGLDPELTMVCPILVKKMADKVEFLAEAARECVYEVVANATESRCLSAFLACGSHRSPMVRAKAALALLLCIRRRCDAATRARAGEQAVERGWGEQARGDRRGSFGRSLTSSRELDRLLQALPRFLQDGHQETRHHAKTMVALLLDADEVDMTRLRREIPAPILERLERDLLNSSLPSGPGFTASTASRNTRKLRGLGPFSRSTSLSSSNSSGYGGGGAGAEGSASWIGAGGGRVGDLRASPRKSVARRGRLELSDTFKGEDDGNDDRSGVRGSMPFRTVAGWGSNSGRIATRNNDEGIIDAERLRRTGAKTRGRGGSGNASNLRRPNGCREAELLPGVLTRLDSGDWRERLSGLEENGAWVLASAEGGECTGRGTGVAEARLPHFVTFHNHRFYRLSFDQRLLRGVKLLEEHGDQLYGAGKAARLIDRMTELLSDGNSKVKSLALAAMARVASSLGSNLEPAVNTLIPAVCKNLASTNQQLIGLAEEALDALCEAVDPCLLVQPVASLAQYGNHRLKIPMLSLLRDLTPVVGKIKPALLVKHVRPAALSLVRENRANVRDAGLSLLRAVELCLE